MQSEETGQFNREAHRALLAWFDALPFPAEQEDLVAPVCVQVKKGGARSMKAGGAWIYDNEVERLLPTGPAETNASDRAELSEDGQQTQNGSEKSSVCDGCIVRVEDFDGYPLGCGIYNSASKIRVRMLTRHTKEGVTAALLRQYLEQAWSYRKAVMGEASRTACRLVFGEADFLPGITVDLFGDVLVIESLARGTDRLKHLLLRDLVQILAQDGIYVRGIYERSDAKVRTLEGMARTKGFIGPEFDTQVPITENGIRYLVDVKDGQKTGFFLDQKYNRAAVAGIVRNLCRGGIHLKTDNGVGKVRVLDCFTHTGSFGLNCAAAGADEVLSVDASETAIRQAQENAVLNGFLPEETSKDAAFAQECSYVCGRSRIRYQTADVFALLPELERAGEQFDVVILDPPAFTKSRQATKNAVKGYREINLRGMKLVRSGGFLATCSCSHFMEEDLFKKTLTEAARGARRRLRQVEFRTQAPDHPILWGDAESYYLKFAIFQVLEEK